MASGTLQYSLPVVSPSLLKGIPSNAAFVATLFINPSGNKLQVVMGNKYYDMVADTTPVTVKATEAGTVSPYQG